MTFEQKTQWAYGFAALVTTLAYAVWLAVQLQDTAPQDVTYVPALLWTLLASFIIHSLGRGMAYGRRPKDRLSDERDREVTRRGDALTFYVFSVLAAIPLALGMAGLDAFWITNTLFLAFAIAAVFGVIAKSVIYARGA
ncbi:hypothetical protein [Demequina activiva]|uniref:Uncharacterized protein n=1 Tax=Demequina activiva TaxID=1582364 RepID=A0A919Q6U1_9MICO|nr:hypothetical protein [Demequina activiva]GIG55628.1 hypothetical protein Dac01nite_23800 [Demequina activiva]